MKEMDPHQKPHFQSKYRSGWPDPWISRAPCLWLYVAAFRAAPLSLDRRDSARIYSRCGGGEPHYDDDAGVAPPPLAALPSREFESRQDGFNGKRKEREIGEIL